MALNGVPSDRPLHIWFPGGWLDQELFSLLAQERHEFEAVLGTQVVFEEPCDRSPRWLVERAEVSEPPSLTWEAATGTLLSRARDPAALMATFSLLQTLAHSPGSRVCATPATTLEGAIERIRDECANSYPYFSLRGLDWEAICSSVLPGRPSTWEEFIPWAAQWVAQLGDAHTAVVEHGVIRHPAPYTAELHSYGAVLISVPRGTAAHAAGARPGWIVQVSRPARWLRTVGASPQQHRRMAARRAMTIGSGGRRFCAKEPGTGRLVRWTELPGVSRAADVVTVQQDCSGDAWVVLHAFDAAAGVEAVFDKVVAGATPSSRMVLDLRGNSGGSTMLAGRLRDRFLRTRTLLGSIAFTDGRGGLSERAPRWASPAAHGRWPGTLTVLVDASTYSAAEDFLLGLKGLDHVTVVGERTGGGSGRPRELPLGPGCSLRISTAITYDRGGRPVEFYGIEPDTTLDQWSAPAFARSHVNAFPHFDP